MVRRDKRPFDKIVGSPCADIKLAMGTLVLSYPVLAPLEGPMMKEARSTAITTQLMKLSK